METCTCETYLRALEFVAFVEFSPASSKSWNARISRSSVRNRAQLDALTLVEGSATFVSVSASEIRVPIPAREAMARKAQHTEGGVLDMV